MNLNKPFSQACENNKQPILKILQDVFKDRSRVLEIGSGTGQHAVHFSEHLRQLLWQPSDCAENLPGIELWLSQCSSPNLLPAVELDVTQADWPSGFDAVFTANTAHIMSWEIASQMVQSVGRGLPESGVFAIYGPFKYQGNYTSESNARFDLWLKEQGEERGIRDFEKVKEVASGVGLMLVEDYQMPANNQLLVWKKSS